MDTLFNALCLADLKVKQKREISSQHKKLQAHLSPRSKIWKQSLETQKKHKFKQA